MKETTVSVAEAKKHLSDLLGRVAYAKESITISRRGKPMARLVPVRPEGEKPHLAHARGWLEEDDDFFATMRTIIGRRRKHVPRTLQRRRK